MIEKIVAVAIRVSVPVPEGADDFGKPFVVSLPIPARHHHLIHAFGELLGRSIEPDDQGFLTNYGRYVGRGKAMEIALAARQVGRKPSHADLYSEDLW